MLAVDEPVAVGKGVIEVRWLGVVDERILLPDAVKVSNSGEAVAGEDGQRLPEACEQGKRV